MSDLDEDDLPPPVRPHPRHPLWAPIDFLGNVMQGAFIAGAGFVRGVFRGVGEGAKDLTMEQDRPPPPPPAPPAPKPPAPPASPQEPKK